MKKIVIIFLVLIIALVTYLAMNSKNQNNYREKNAIKVIKVNPWEPIKNSFTPSKVR